MTSRNHGQTNCPFLQRLIEFPALTNIITVYMLCCYKLIADTMDKNDCVSGALRPQDNRGHSGIVVAHCRIKRMRHRGYPDNQQSLPTTLTQPSHTMPTTPMPTRGSGDLSQVYGDDWSDKEVFLQATGLHKDSNPSNPRHVLVYWVNAALSGGFEVWDITQLEMHGHWHQYHYPNALKVNTKERSRNQTMSLGIFTSEQREQLLELAADVEYDQVTTESRTWMRNLLAKMAEEKLISHHLFNTIREDVPLPSA